MSQIKGKIIKVVKVRYVMKRPNLIYVNFAREDMTPSPPVLPKRSHSLFPDLYTDAANMSAGSATI